MSSSSSQSSFSRSSVSTSSSFSFSSSSTSSNSSNSSIIMNSTSSSSSILLHSTSSLSSLSSYSSLSSILLYSTSSLSSKSSKSSSSHSSLSKSSKSSESSASESSSSFHFSFSKLLPFTFEEDSIKPVLCLAYDGTYIYAGTGDNGKILRSIDGMIWDLYFKTNDMYVKSLYVDDNKLYIGTYPNGLIYISDLSTNEISLSQNIGSEVSSFINYQGDIYAFTSNKSGVYKYNTNLLRWELIYSPYANIIYKTIVINDEIFILINSNNIIKYNGKDFYLQEIATDLQSESSTSSSGEEA